jgi:hypothetical protein
MVYFYIQKSQFENTLEILETDIDEIFYIQSKYFTAICQFRRHLVYFSLLLVCCAEKTLATPVIFAVIWYTFLYFWYVLQSKIWQPRSVFVCLRCRVLRLTTPEWEIGALPFLFTTLAHNQSKNFSFLRIYEYLFLGE